MVKRKKKVRTLQSYRSHSLRGVPQVVRQISGCIYLLQQASHSEGTIISSGCLFIKRFPR